jgi:hypothetical protein
LPSASSIGSRNRPTRCCSIRSSDARAQVKGTRELVISRTPFIAVYRLLGTQGIEVLRLMHGAQQWPPAAASKKGKVK